MAYIGQKSNPLGVDDFIRQLGEADYGFLTEIQHLIDELCRSLDRRDVYPLDTSSREISRRLISIAVDGGSQQIFPYFREISMGLIRVSAYCEDFKEQPPSFPLLVRNYEIFDISKSKSQDTTHSLQNKRKEFIEKLFSQDLMKPLVNCTGISLEDIGNYIFKDINTFTNILRNILEWAYIVYINEQYRNIKILIVKDGRLEQHGVNNDFVEKLKKYFESTRTYIVGVVKSTKLLREGIPAMVIAKWIEDFASNTPVYLKVPKELMEYTFGFEQQWNPDFDGSFVFGTRYIGKFIPQTFRPLQSVFTFDVPYYLSDDKKSVREIVHTLFHYRSFLYDGSISVVSEAHEAASLDYSILKMIETEVRRTIEQRSQLKIPEGV